jgi:hypothetical protein
MKGWEEPTIIDYGSIVEHTFSRCNPDAPNEIPPKDSFDVPHQIDQHLECSAIDGGGMS